MDPEIIFNFLITTVVTLVVWIVLTMATERKTDVAPIVPHDADMISPAERASNAAILSEARKNYVLDLSKSRSIGKFFLCITKKIGPEKVR